MGVKGVLLLLITCTCATRITGDGLRSGVARASGGGLTAELQYTLVPGSCCCNTGFVV